jgi:hypothetical protein
MLLFQCTASQLSAFHSWHPFPTPGAKKNCLLFLLPSHVDIQSVSVPCCFFLETIGLVLHIYGKTMINFVSFLLTFSPQDRNIHFPEYCIYFLYFWTSRRWTKSKLWTVFSQYVKLIKSPLMDLVTVKTRHSEQWLLLAYAWHFCVAPCFSGVPGSSVGIATGYGLDGRGLNPGRCQIFRTCPDRPWGSPSLLYNGYRVFSGGKERPGRDADLSLPSSAVVKKG